MVRGLGEDFERALGGNDRQLLHLVGQEAHIRGLPLYAVGGLPRDVVLGRQPADFDLVAEGDAVEFAGYLAAKFGGRSTSHLRFRTARWHLSDDQTRAWAGDGGHRDYIDLISARTESYARPGALPTVRPGSIEDDLRRRDFTINCLAIRLDGPHFGSILDPLGALADLKRGAIRVLHDASFSDDPTRMFRAVRYEKRLEFRMTAKTVRLVEGARGRVAALSAQRLRAELDRGLAEEAPDSILRRLGNLGILRAAHPSLPHDRESLKRLKTIGRQEEAAAWASQATEVDRRWLVWLMALTPRQIASVDQRLHFNARLKSLIKAASALYRKAPSLGRLRPSSLTTQLDSVPLVAVEVVHRILPAGDSKARMSRYLAEWRHVRPKTTGAALRAVGLPSGIAYRRILQALRKAWIDGDVRSSQEEAELLDRLLRRQARRSPARDTIRKAG